MRGRIRPLATAAACIAGFAAGTAAESCTTFNGATLPDASDASVADASAETGKPPVAGFLPLADAARLCSLVGRCPFLAPSILASSAVPIDPVNYSLCVHWLAAPVPPDRVGFAIQAQTFACMAKQTTCEGAGACLSIDEFGPTDPRCADAAADAGEHCSDDGGTVLHCAGGYALHCGAAFYAPGSRCLQGDDMSHWCALNGKCTTSGGCEGTVFDYCGAGNNLHFAIDCGFDGYSCGVSDDGGTQGCLTNGAVKACNGAGTSCSGDIVEVCDGVNDSEFDCAALGGTCSAKSGPALCVKPGDGCTPFDTDIDVCDGSAVSLCVGGQKTKLDCGSIGMTCVPGGASSGRCG
jgi:hypothetical protein